MPVPGFVRRAHSNLHTKIQTDFAFAMEMCIHVLDRSDWLRILHMHTMIALSTVVFCMYVGEVRTQSLFLVSD